MSCPMLCPASPSPFLQGFRAALGMLPGSVLLICFALFGSAALLGCGAPSSTGSANAEPSGSGSSGSGTFPPLPGAPAEDGSLSRSYAGWQLGQPAPDLEKTTEDSRYPAAIVYIDKLKESPRVFRRAYVHEGTVFLIEWIVKDPGLEIDEVAARFAEVLGPLEESKWIPDHVKNWNDGLSEGNTSYTIFRLPGSEWLKVSVEDVGRGGALTGLI